MNDSSLALCLLNLTLIGALPRLFFRPGRLNLAWWLTAVPFLASAALLLGGLAGIVPPWTPPPPGPAILASAAAVLSAASFTLIGWTLGTHRRALALWHQPEDAPEALVTDGAYARVRHPFYAAFLLALLACAAALPHPATAAAFLYGLVRLDRTAAREERRLLASAFGAAYAEYLRRTGRFWPARRQRGDEEAGRRPVDRRPREETLFV